MGGAWGVGAPGVAAGLPRTSVPVRWAVRGEVGSRVEFAARPRCRLCRSHAGHFGALQKPELREPQNWGEAPDTERLWGLLSSVREAIRGRDAHRRAPEGPQSEGSVRAVPEGISADDRSGDWRAHLQTVRKAGGRQRRLCLLPVAACRGACGGVHLDARLSALRVRVRAVRGFARRAGL